MVVGLQWERERERERTVATQRAASQWLRRCAAAGYSVSVYPVQQFCPYLGVYRSLGAYTESCECMQECMQTGLHNEEIPPWEYLGVFSSGEGPFGSLPPPWRPVSEGCIGEARLAP